MNALYKITGRYFSKWEKALDEIEKFVKSVNTMKYLRAENWMIVWADENSLFTYHLVDWCERMNEHLYTTKIEDWVCY